MIMSEIENKKNGSTAFGLAIASFVTAWFIPLVGVILGWISLRMGKKAGITNHKWWAITGIVVNAIGTLLLTLLIVAGVALFAEYAPEIQACIDNSASDAQAEACLEGIFPKEWTE
jgi:uncharacterized membrane protein